MTTDDDLTRALANLNTGLDALLSARQSVLLAEGQLTGAHHARCTELGDKLNDAICFAWRLSKVVEGDRRAAAAEVRQ